MIETTLQLRSGRVSFWMLPHAPSWGSGFRVTVASPALVEKVLSGAEVRRPLGVALRIRQEFDALVVGAEAQRLEAWLDTHETELVGVPFWPALAPATGSREPFRAAAWVAVSAGHDRHEAFESTPPAWVGPDDMVVPLVFGRIESREMNWADPALATVRIVHQEASEARLAVSLAPHAEPVGPIAASSGAPAASLFPLAVNFLGPSQEADAEVDREEIGFGREPEERMDAPPVREFKLEVTADSRAEFARALAFFEQRSAATPFWIPAPGEALQITASVPSGGVLVPTAGAGTVAAGDWLAFTDPGQTPRFAKVSAVEGSNVRLVSSAGALARGSTFVSRLVLARFRADRMTWLMTTPANGTAQVDLREVAIEEDVGRRTFPHETAGAVLPKVWLYELRQGNTVEFLTSHEAPVQVGAALYQPARITHGEISVRTNGAPEDVRLELGAKVSRLAMDALASRSSGRIRVKITEALLSVGTVADATVVFTGEHDRVAISGLTVGMTARHWPALAGARCASFRIQPGCNHVLFRPGCDQDPADWEFSALVANPGLPGFPFTFALYGLTGPESVTAADWFAGGWVQIGSDKISVRRSTAPSAGALTVTLARDPREFPVAGAHVTLFPGCDGRWETCREKFDNGDNFGGHPFVPTSNPSLVKLSPAFAGGKK